MQLSLTCFQENDFALRQTELGSHLRQWSGFQLFYSYTCTAQLVSCIKTSFTMCSQNTDKCYKVFIVVQLSTVTAAVNSLYPWCGKVDSNGEF